MIERIVKMTFKPENTEIFEKIFYEVKTKIASFEGCKNVRLLKDTKNSCIYFTISLWENEKALENYRNSELFNETWQKTKILFSEKPMAWSISENLTT